MATKILALFMTLSIIGVLFVAGNTKADSAPSPMASVTHVATEIVVVPTDDPTEEPSSDVLVGDPARGQELFQHGLNDAPPCSSCHNAAVSGKSGFAVGPGLKGIHERAASRVEGLTAPEYIENSIRNPADYLVAGYQPIMYPLFAEKYSDQDIADLVAYLMTL